MIFSEDYDKTLWLILSSNKDTRERVRKLINMLPENIYNEIQSMILDYKRGINSSYKKSYDYIDGYGYYIVVKVIDKTLSFNITRWKEDKVRTEEEYTLCLVPVTKEELLEMEYFDKKSLGSYDSEIYDNITYDPYRKIDFTGFNRRYCMRKIPFGVIVNTSLGKKIFNISGVNINKNMLDEMFVDSFDSADKVDVLVKKKTRKRLGE